MEFEWVLRHQEEGWSHYTAGERAERASEHTRDDEVGEMATDGYIHYYTNPPNSFGSLGLLVLQTRCYHQPNDRFTIENGVWKSENDPAAGFPERCMTMNSPKTCPRAGCCIDCADGYTMGKDGICLNDKEKGRGKKVNIFLAIMNNATGLNEAVDDLVKHRTAFTGIIFQYDGICSASSKEGDCNNSSYYDPVHFDVGHPAYPVSDVTNLFRSKLGDDLELFPIVSYGDTNDNTPLTDLITNATLSEQVSE